MYIPNYYITIELLFGCADINEGFNKINICAQKSLVR